MTYRKCSSFQFPIFKFSIRAFSNSHIFNLHRSFKSTVSKCPIFKFSNFKVPKGQNVRIRIPKCPNFKHQNWKFKTVRYTDLPTFSEFHLLRYGEIIISKEFRAMWPCFKNRKRAKLQNYKFLNVLELARLQSVTFSNFKNLKFQQFETCDTRDSQQNQDSRCWDLQKQYFWK